ncbi:YggS family pyridoxal phosphate-dependent enzyme [Polaromonas sp.]|uniref:YggS family pyridoxal phosphate-dependent enzyme n=1 Tax=Polaromonas sp. TaxID=1869339 RepID=UPI00273145DE|nr:YggS family pyridoxal phosphate-dependent enzyme [Polaromonas sp.]MDP1740645.1 YggS family pyridoxal phosphate-dependent enzyme [Polaromonas sp.]
MTMIVDNLQAVHARIAAACAACGRDPGDVRLLAVSKTFGPDAVIEALSGGQSAFGENYIQEGVEKILSVLRWEADGLRLSSSGHSSAFRSPPSAGPLSIPPEWHCIGPIQSNKTRLVAEHFDWVQSVDRLKIAQRLSEQRPEHLPPLQVCLQVNIDGGANKAGVSPDDALALAAEVARLPRLQLRGIMSIPEPAIDFVAACAIHKRAAGLFGEINAAGVLPRAMDTLSMGMTADLEAAIHAGSTMVRVGTAIFGGR